MNGPRLSIIPARAATDPNLKPRDLQALCVLGRHTDELGWCRKSQVKMAEEMRCARSTVFDAIERLVKAGYLERHVQEEENGRDSPHVYRVILDPKHPNPALVREADSGTEAAAPPADISAPPAGPGPAPPAGPGPAPKNDPIRTTDSERERETARAAGKTETWDRRAIERWLKRHFTAWPNYAFQSENEAVKAAMALTPQEREAAVDRMADYLAGEKEAGGRSAYSTYLHEKRWERLGPKGAERTDPPRLAAAPAFGPDWSQMLFEVLLDGPVDPGPPEMTRAKRLAAYETMRSMLGDEKAEAHYRRMGHDVAADGTLLFPDDFEARMAREHLTAKGWPLANELLHAARDGRASRLPPGFVPRRELFEAVPVGLSMWRCWFEAFARRGWPWLPDPGKQPVVYFPAGGPEALPRFEAAVRGRSPESGRDDDAAGSEAAE